MKENKYMRALVAGGAGFIGSHLCDRLIKNSYKVLCIDVLHTSCMKNVHHLLENSKFSFDYAYKYKVCHS